MLIYNIYDAELISVITYVYFVRKLNNITPYYSVLQQSKVFTYVILMGYFLRQDAFLVQGLFSLLDARFCNGLIVPGIATFCSR